MLLKNMLGIQHCSGSGRPYQKLYGFVGGNFGIYRELRLDFDGTTVGVEPGSCIIIIVVLDKNEIRRSLPKPSNLIIFFFFSCFCNRYFFQYLNLSTCPVHTCSRRHALNWRGALNLRNCLVSSRTVVYTCRLLHQWMLGLSPCLLNSGNTPSHQPFVAVQMSFYSFHVTQRNIVPPALLLVMSHRQLCCELPLRQVLSPITGFQHKLLFRRWVSMPRTSLASVAVHPHDAWRNQTSLPWIQWEVDAL